jgi:hypothetical protein
MSLARNPYTLSKPCKIWRHDSMSRTLDEWRADIREYAPQVDRASHAHNLINLALRNINEQFGEEEANRAVRDFKLEAKGWSQR